MARSRDPYNYVPKDYEDLYRYYVDGTTGSSLARQIITKYVRYATPDERETLLQEIALRCIAKDILGKFDPAKANFGGIFFTYARSACVNYLARKSRNPITGLCAGSLATSSAGDKQFEPGEYSLDRCFGAHKPDLEGRLDQQAALDDLFEFAEQRAAKPKNTRDKNLLSLLELMLRGLEPKQIGETLGVTASTIHNWILYLRQHA